MRSLVFLALLLPLVGCGKKTAKSTGSNADDTAAVTPQSVTPAVKVKPAEKGDAAKPEAKKPAERPNWLNDPRFKKDDQLPAEAPANGKQPWVAPGAVAVAPAPGPAPMGGTPAAKLPAEQPPPKQPAAKPPEPKASTTPAAARKVSKDDMKEVWIFIENASLASGKMPSPEVTYAALIQAESPAAGLVKDGSIVLTGARQREAIWAYEKNAPKQGGWVATQNGAEQLTAAEFVSRATGR